MPARPFRLCVLLAAALLASGCDTSFEPFAESEKYYSVWGYLDPSADTQWVRIEPLRDPSLIGSGPINARVTTRNLKTGQTAVWHDSTFTLPSGPVLHNFWTTADIKPEATYRFAVEGEAGTTTAEVTTPELFPPPEVTGQVPGIFVRGGSNVVTVTLRNVQTVGGVDVDYRYLVCPPPPECCYSQQRHFYPLERIRQVDEETWRIVLPWKAYMERTLPPDLEFSGFYTFRVTVASVSEDWPDYRMPVDSLTAPPPPGRVSNIEHGVGYLGGAVVKTVHVPIIER